MTTTEESPAKAGSAPFVEAHSAHCEGCPADNLYRVAFAGASLIHHLEVKLHLQTRGMTDREAYCIVISQDNLKSCLPTPLAEAVNTIEAISGDQQVGLIHRLDPTTGQPNGRWTDARIVLELVSRVPDRDVRRLILRFHTAAFEVEPSQS